MKASLKKIANILTITATIFFVIGLVYFFVKNRPIGDLISTVSFCYVSIAAFNYLMFGAATLWHMKADTE